MSVASDLENVMNLAPIAVRRGHAQARPARRFGSPSGAGLAAGAAPWAAILAAIASTA